ncbi:sensor histidine kinase [Rhodosalinus sp.]|uniref:sensor histidine kinase n=1 Tax=Rhodosalinus sp. TaxID=2047741 RepID=UPI003564C46B
MAEHSGAGRPPPGREPDLVLGDDWVAPEPEADEAARVRRGFFSWRRSPLTRKIIIFNLIALNILVAGIFYLDGSRESLALQRATGLAGEAELIADVFEVQAASPGDMQRTLEGLDLRRGIEVLVYDEARRVVARQAGEVAPADLDALHETPPRTVITDALARAWGAVENGVEMLSGAAPRPLEEQIVPQIGRALDGRPTVETGVDAEGGTVISATTPIIREGRAVGVVAVSSAAGEIDQMVRAERERVLQMFVIAILVSIGLSLVLASTISNPISQLATAAEVGRDRDRGRFGRQGRIRIPDLTARPDEIGQLSAALRGMVSALYDRIEANEQFAADVAHEIKNPLASLRSAVGTLRVAQREDHRERLLDVIDHDVRRLDRLVSDISNASRLDSELVKEDEESFDLRRMLDTLGQHLGQQAQEKGIEFITDLPEAPVAVQGLEPRLAQVVVNLVTNAISFCEEGDAIRLWARKRENRVLVVVEDTGPGIPEGAEKKIFKRFYSERPSEDFGNNSGLGLAISEQIVHAHGGVIWAENIRPTQADPTSEPLGARFVVGLPL